MKKILLFLGIMVILLIGCDSVDYAMKLYVKENTDRIEILIYQKTQEKGRQALLVTSFSDSTNIKRLLDFITRKKTPFYKCGYTGSIVYLGGANSYVVQKMDFNTQLGCEHIVFTYKDELHSRHLTDEGIAFLDSLYQKYKN